MERSSLKDLQAQLFIERSNYLVESSIRTMDRQVGQHPLQAAAIKDLDDLKRNLRKTEDVCDSDIVALRVMHDENLTNLRLEYGEKFHMLTAAHNKRMADLRDRFEAQELSEVARLESVSRGRIDTRLLEHSNVISACKDEGATSVKDSSQRLSRLRLERSQLRKFVDSQHIALDHLCRKLCESGAPVAALASKVSSLEAHVTKFKSEVAPALATVKQKVKRLQMRLKEKSLQLECLLQKRELETKPVRDQSGLKQALDTVFSRLYACDPDTTCEAETVCSDS